MTFRQKGLDICTNSWASWCNNPVGARLDLVHICFEARVHIMFVFFCSTGKIFHWIFSIQNVLFFHTKKKTYFLHKNIFSFASSLKFIHITEISFDKHCWWQISEWDMIWYDMIWEWAFGIFKNNPAFAKEVESIKSKYVCDYVKFDGFVAPTFSQLENQNLKSFRMSGMSNPWIGGFKMSVLYEHAILLIICAFVWIAACIFVCLSVCIFD